MDKKTADKIRRRRIVVRALKYGGLTKDSYYSVQENIYAYNARKLYTIWPFLTVFVLINLFNRLFVMEEKTSSIIMIVIGLVLLGFHVFAVRTRRHTFFEGVVVPYATFSYGFLFATIIGTVGSMMPDAPAVTMIGCIVLLPFCVMDAVWRMYLMQILNTLVFIGTCYVFNSSKTFSMNVFNSLSFLAVTMVVYLFVSKDLIHRIADKAISENERNSDDLTKLLNRKATQMLITSKLGNGVKDEGEIEGSFFFLDVDNFKHVNDTYGHAYGDKILKNVASAIRSSFRHGDVLGRFGGDEFICFMENGDRDFAIMKAHLIKENFQRLIQDEPEEFTLSIGIALVDSKDAKYSELFEKADQALYEVKKSTKNGCRIFGEEEDTSVEISEVNRRKKDSLTGLSVNAKFIEDVRLRLMDADFNERPVLAYLNVEDFKRYNSTLEFARGDMLLKEMGKVILEVFQDCPASHQTGDHFVVYTTYNQAVRGIKQVDKKIEEYTKDLAIRIKAGIYELKSASESVSVARDCAKIAADSIRKKSNYLYAEYDESLRQQVEITQYIVSNFERALHEGWIKLYLQPIIRSITGQISDVEALARWEDPERGMIYPDQFISVLEDYQLIHKLDLYILECLCQQMQLRNEEKSAVVPGSFNISQLDFESCDVLSEINRIVDYYGIPRNMFHVEITESQITSDTYTIRRIIEDFKNAGYEVWMDDFGSGYSSLSNLKEMKYDCIKIDMEFLRSFDERSKKVLASMIDMAKQLGIRTLVEGVETKEHAAFLKSIGCEKQQGYLYSKPLTPADLYKSVEPVIGMESEEDCTYFTELGRVNYLSPIPFAIDAPNRDFMTIRKYYHPLAIYEKTEQGYRYLSWNGAFADELGIVGMQVEEIPRDKMSGSMAELYDAIREVEKLAETSKKTEKVTLPINSKTYTLTVRQIVEAETREAFLLSIQVA